MADPFLASHDKTVVYVARWICFICADDLDNRVSQLPKYAWDYVQRLLLVLDSDDHIIENTERRWRWSQ